ncbi:MAG: prolipoprotein diacylglyceryl transferase, partial [Pseudomonadales bacterium]
MLTYPEIDPVAISLGPLEVHWYGLMYLLSFLIVWRLFVYRAKKPWSPIQPGQAEDLIFNGALGVVIGGRLGYV